MRKLSLLFFIPSCINASGLSRRTRTMPAESVVVTATRTPQPAEKTGKSISVITSDELEQQQIVSLTDILSETPGLDCGTQWRVGTECHGQSSRRGSGTDARAD